MSWIKEHWEAISALALGGFGFGGIVSVQKSHGEKISKLEIILEKEIPEIKDMLARIDERTKKL